MITTSSDIPLSLYIHIPWCEKKCPYCDFNSHMARAEVDEQAYIQSLLDDLDADLAQHKTALANRTIETIFIGGGTPSLFKAESIKVLLDGIEQRINLSDQIEITLEANPGSSEANKFNGFRQAGVNRLSIGIQSFNPKHLLALGRVHNSTEALNAATYAKQAGFEQFNLDLMFGLPEQSLEQSLADLQTAIELAPSHLSCYQLTIEPNTLFHHQPPITPDAERLWEMQTALQAVLAKQQYQHYEVSAYASANSQCRHNLNYWQFGDYLGIGAGAHGKITSTSGKVTRTWKIKHPTTFLENQDKIGGLDVIKAEQLPFEFMLNALRLINGFSSEVFEQRTGLSISNIEAIMSKHQDQGLLEINDNHICPSERGKLLIDSMLQDYLM